MYSLDLMSQIKIIYLLVKLSVSECSCLRALGTFVISLGCLLLVCGTVALLSLDSVQVFLCLVGTEIIAILIFHVNVAVGFVFDEHTLDFGAINLGDAVEADSLIVLPVTVVNVSTEVVVLAGRVSLVVLHVAFIELSIGEEDLDLAVSHFPVFEAAFNQFVTRGEEPSEAMRSIFLPSSTVNTTVRELAEAGGFTLAGFEIALVNLTVGKEELALAVPLALADTTFVDDVGHISEFVFCFLKTVHPVTGDSRSDADGNNEIGTLLLLGVSVDSDGRSVAGQSLLLVVLASDHGAQGGLFEFPVHRLDVFIRLRHGAAADGRQNTSSTVKVSPRLCVGVLVHTLRSGIGHVDFISGCL